MTILADLTRMENENKMLSNMLKHYTDEVQRLRKENRDMSFFCPLLHKMHLEEISKKKIDVRTGLYEER